MQKLGKYSSTRNVDTVDSYLIFRGVNGVLILEAKMSDEKKEKKSAPKPETKADKKGSETVHLSAEDLRKISGGSKATKPPHG